MFYAHSSQREDKSIPWQTLRDHLQLVGAKAASRGSKVGAGKAAELAGRLHDLGKYSEGFLSRLNGSAEVVDHSTAGAWHVMEALSPSPDRLVAELCAYAIAGHHAGLPDMLGSDASLDSRLSKFVDNIDPVWRDEISVDRTDLLPKDFKFVGHDGKASMPFRFAMLGRYIFSCLVDADYRDTEAYYDGINSISRDREFKPLQELVGPMTASLDRHMAQLRSRSAAESDVARTRQEIFDTIVSKANMSPGFFTMNVPTGGGKTLSSTAFALAHAAAHGMDRIIYGIPFTSVIDQTADILRKILGSDNVLEHHSAVGNEDAITAGQRKLRMATEDWSAPVVVTTNVQFFESLMTAKPSKARKIHNIARSVIILDEAQTIQRHLLIPCVAILDELVRNYGCTVILCTATQPAFNDAVLRAGHKLALHVSGRELAPDPATMGERLRRVSFRIAGNLSDEELLAELGDEKQALVVVNSRKHALKLYELAVSGEGDGFYHLSTRQTAWDRKRILEEIRQRLRDGNPCRVISTSLIEAGVDIDFPKVWRCEAGLDQIAQAAGRCNREGARPASESVVTIFSNPEYPAPNEMRGLIRDMKAALRKHGDILSPSAIQEYFLETYWRVGDEGLDALGIMDLFKMAPQGTVFSYRSAAEKFKLVDSNNRSVIIPAALEASDIIRDLSNPEVRSVKIARQLQTHIVQIPANAFDRLVMEGKVSAEAPALRDQEFMILRDLSLYSADHGLIWE